MERATSRHLRQQNITWHTNINSQSYKTSQLYLGAEITRHRSLHRLEAVRAVLAHVLRQHVGHDGLLHRDDLPHRDVLAGHGVPAPALLVLEGDGVAHHRVELVPVGDVGNLRLGLHLHVLVLGEVGRGGLVEGESLQDPSLHLGLPVASQLGGLVHVLQSKLVSLPSVGHLLEGYQTLGLPVVQLVGEVVRVAHLETELDVVQSHPVGLEAEEDRGPVGQQDGQLPGLSVSSHRTGYYGLVR